MKRIYKLSIVIVFAVIIASCTDEKDFIDNKPSKANKNLEEELIRRPYYQYEQYDISPEELYDDLVEFADAINGAREMPTLNINQALLLMETFFNYAIVDKQEIYDTSISYENTVFTFTVDLGEEDMIENPNQLRQNFQAFIEDVRAEMGNKYMQFSDLYVLEKDYNFITFA
ncbi:MAG: hypothetical protein PHD62_09145, partial [Bacteroidales bacterium]|nr:hypothetical protein [Bacteroidales bacterium]